jgi:O-antigen/teichoic acid export membrane protein
MQRLRANMVIRLLGITVLAVLLPLAVPRFGLVGAAWAMVAGGLFTLLVSASLVLRAIRRFR